MPTEIKFEITDHLATLSTSPKGWTKELNLVSWNGAAAKYNIRDWSQDHSKMGVTLSMDEVKAALTGWNAWCHLRVVNHIVWLHGDRSCGRIETHREERENRSAMGRLFFRGKG